MAELSARPLNVPSGSFAWIYLVEWIVIGLLSLFFLFYFNRLFATLVSYAIRLVAWRKFKIHIDIEALQISLLAGRVFFKGVRYHGENVTAFIHSGNITWRYWIPVVCESPLFEKNVPNDSDPGDDKQAAADETGQKRKARRLPCRIAVNVQAVEAFCYNRSPSYDFLLDTLKRNQANGHQAGSQTDFALYTEKAGYEKSRAAEGHSSSTELPSTPEGNASYLRKLRHTETLRPAKSASTSSTSPASTAASDRPAAPSILRLLPVHVTCNTAAVVLGNQNTRAIITAKLESAEGTFSASHASSHLDPFKILMDFDIKHPVIQMRPNVDFKGPQLAEAMTNKAIRQESPPTRKQRWFRWLRGKSSISAEKARNSFFWLTRIASESAESVAIHSSSSSSEDRTQTWRKRANFPYAARWQGLARYLDDGINDETEEWNPVEYAKVSTLADIESVGFNFYWDIPGRVPANHSPSETGTHTLKDDMNGGSPPDYGMVFKIRGGNVAYGPWADRHRLELQQLFFPAIYSDARPSNALEPGATRVSTIFKIDVLVEGDTVMRIPFREPSKDWKWRGRSTSYKAQSKEAQDSSSNNKFKGRKKSSKDKREKAKTAAASDIRPFAWFDLKVKDGTKVVYTMDMFPRAEGYKMDLKVDVNRLEIFSSLNHALLWTCPLVSMSCDLSNPLGWRALREWQFNIAIGGLDFFLLRDHTFLLLDLIEDWTRGPEPDYYTFVPFRYILNVRLENLKLFLNVNDSNIVNHSDELDDNDFAILYAHDVKSELIIPLDRFKPEVSNIIFDVEAKDLGFELRMPPKNTLSDLLVDKNVARLPSAIVKGVYTQCMEVAPGRTDTLVMDIIGDSLDLQFFGFFGRQLMKVKENYFGEDLHFKTTEEYQKSPHNPAVEEPMLKSNDLDTILNISAKDAQLQLPAGIYSSNEHLWLKVDTVNIDIRVNNYFLELVVDSTPIELGYTVQELLEKELSQSVSGPELFIEGVNVTGHRMFGVGKGEPTYVSTWDVDAGAITSRSSHKFLSKAVSAAQCIALTIQDKENALPVLPPPPLHDRTYVRFGCPVIQIQTEIDDETFAITLAQVHGSFNDAVDAHFSQKVIMRIPTVEFAALDTTASRRSDQLSIGDTLAFMRTSVSLTVLQRMADFEQQRQAQHEHIASMDSKGRRVVFFYEDYSQEEVFRASIPLPCLPRPLRNSDTLSAYERTVANGATPSDTDDGVAQQPAATAKRHERVQSVLPFATAYSQPFRTTRLSNLDFSNVPSLRPIRSHSVSTAQSDASSEVFNPGTSNDSEQTSIILSVSPGIAGFLTPRAVNGIAMALDRLNPSTPDRIFDQLQFETMTEVVASLNKDQGKNAILDLSIKVPQINIRLLNDSILENVDGVESSADQWDLQVDKIASSVRIKQMPQRRNESDSIAVHLTVGALCLEARPVWRESHPDPVAFRMGIDDVLVWLVDGDRTTVRISFDDFQANLASEQVGYLANLVHRTTVFADHTQARFADVAMEKTRRQQLVVFELTQKGEDISDPAFLMRPAYAISQGGEQIRSNDSWKILSRLRHTMINLRDDDMLRLLKQCADGRTAPPPNSEVVVLSILDNWRSWEAIRVRESYVMRIVYPNYRGIEKLHDRNRIPQDIKLEAGSIKALVDPGSRQNTMALDGLTVAISVIPPPPPSAVRLFQEHSGFKSTTVQVSTNEMSLKLNWDMYDLVDRIWTLFESTQLKSHPSTTEVVATNADVRESEGFHIVFASRRGLVALDSPSLSQVYNSHGLKASVAGTLWQEESKPASVVGLAAADSTEVTLRSIEKIIGRGGLQNPRASISFDNSLVSGVPINSIALVANSERVDWEMVEDIHGLILMTDAVLNAEVRSIKALMDAHMAAVQTSHKSSNLSRESVLDNISLNLALLLKSYDVSVSLTTDVVYALHGEMIRLSISPDTREPSTLIANFDLMSQTHEIRTQTLQSAGALNVPNINGGGRLMVTQGAPSGTASLAMEKAILDGSAISGIMNALLTAQVMSAANAIMQDVASLSSNYRQLFTSTVEQDKQPQHSDSPTFDLSFALADVSMIAMAPQISDQGNVGINFFSGPLRARLSNRSGSGARALPFPEMQISMQKAGLQVENWDSSQRVDIGTVAVAVALVCTVQEHSSNCHTRNFKLSVYGPNTSLHAATIPALVRIVSDLQSKLQSLRFDERKRYMKRLRHVESREGQSFPMPDPQSPTQFEGGFETNFELDLQAFQIIYMVEQDEAYGKEVAQDLALTLESLKLTARSSKEAEMQARNLMLQLTPKNQNAFQRSENSALFPEALFHVTHQSSKADRKLKFYASGRALEVWLDARFIVPMKVMEKSMTASIAKSKEVASTLKISQPAELPKKNILGSKTLSHLVVDAKFAGAIINIRKSRSPTMRQIRPSLQALDRLGSKHEKYDQFSDEDSAGIATLRAPGVGLKVELIDAGTDKTSLNVEIQVNQSSNAFSPAVVPIILELSDSIKQVVEQTGPMPPKDTTAETSLLLISDESIVNSDPTVILGKVRLNVGFRIRKQEFTLSCHPIAKIAATARIEDIYFTANTVDAAESGHFFAATAMFRGLEVSLKHDFSRDATFGFDMESITLSLMNSKHISGMPGVSAILRIKPTKTHVNAKQLQDILLFREVWLPPEIRINQASRNANHPGDQNEYFVHRYQQLTQSKKFRWNATVAVAEMKIDLDLGQAIGKVSLGISNLWATSHKSTNSQQTLCIGIDNVSADSAGRMSGLIALRRVHVRTSIAWPSDEPEYRTPLVQGSIGFDEIRIKAAFDYQLFAVAHVTDFEFIMYNVRDRSTKTDRLVAILDGSKVHAYCTSSSASLGLALFQAFERLVQEKQASYEQALKDIERYLHRKRPNNDETSSLKSDLPGHDDEPEARKKSPFSLRLHTDVVISLRALDLGAFPGTFFDAQLVRLTASDVQAGFNAMVTKQGSIQSGLGLTLGKVSAALASVPSPIPAKAFAEMEIEEVVRAAASASRGVILGVPKVIASMHTWQAQDSHDVDYIFKSIFDGKIDVGWNYARISYIRGMWANHTRTLAARLGKPLPESAVKLSGAPLAESDENGGSLPGNAPPREEQKITATVNLPQSRFRYRALEPPIIDTPQLRDMGEATPPLEWVGLQRDKLPNVTHQIIIVTLLEVAREVEDAYTKILGSAAS